MLRRSLIVLLAFGAGLGVGAFAGYRCLVRPQLFLASVGESFFGDQYAYTQYREASYPEAQKALEAYLGYLKRDKPSNSTSWTPGENPWLDSRGLRFESTLTWSRLAILHERNGNEPASDRAWKQAETLAAQGTWKDPSRDHLREVIARLDRAREPLTSSTLPPKGA